MERYQKLLFGFLLSYAPLSREQAFRITADSFIKSFQEDPPDPHDGYFLESVFRQAIKACEVHIPAGAPDVIPLENVPAPKEGSLKIVRKAVFHLSPGDKAIILLRDQCHLPFEHIAAVMGTDARQVRSACLASRERLREAMRHILEDKGK